MERESIRLQFLLSRSDEVDRQPVPKNEYFETLKKLIENKNWESLQEHLQQEKFQNIINFKDNTGYSLIHIAALQTVPEGIQILLTAGARPNVKDVELERTPLHLVVSTGCRCSECSSQRVKCIELLINGGARTDSEDKNHETPLYYAARNMFSECSKLLLDKGCNLYHWNDNTSVATLLIEYLPDVMSYELDKCVGYDLSDTSKLQVDFSLILQIHAIKEGYRKRKNKGINNFNHHQPPRETELLQSVLKARMGKEVLVSHPVIEAFLHFKWIAVRKFFFILRSVFFVLLILYTALIFRIYSNACLSYSANKTSDNCQLSPDDQIMGGILYLFTALIVVSEIYKMFEDFSGYISSGWTAYLWWVLSAMWVVTLLPIFRLDPPQYFQYPVAAIGVIYSWLMTLVQLERIPWFAVHVGLLVKVVKDFLRLLITFSTILVAFALGFCILLPENYSFNTIPTAMFKVFMMMKGDIDYEGIMDINNNPYLIYPEYAFPAHLIYTMFVIVVTMLLTSLLIGLAVKDIEEVEQQARVNRSIRLIQEIGIFESLIQNRFLMCGISPFFKQFSIERCAEIEGYKLRFSPVHPDDKTLPKNIKDNFIPYMSTCPCQNHESLQESVL